MIMCYDRGIATGGKSVNVETPVKLKKSTLKKGDRRRKRQTLQSQGLVVKEAE